MTHKDDPETQRPVSRLFSGIGLKIFLIILLSGTALSFTALGLQRSWQPSSLTPPQGQNKIYKPVILKPGQFEIKTAKAESKRLPARADRTKSPETSPLPVSSGKPLATTVTASTTTTSIPTTTEPTITLAPGEAVKVTAQKFNLPPPKWQSLDKNWDKVKLTEAPKLDKSKLKGGGWQQLDLGQAKKVNLESEGQPSTIAALRAKPPKKSEQPAAAKPKPRKKTSKPKTIKPKTVVRKTKKPGQALAIINETGKAGMGQVYRDVLEAMGYPVTLVKDKPRRPGITTIYYKPAAKARARRLGDRIPEEKRLAPLTWSSQFDIVVMIR